MTRDRFKPAYGEPITDWWQWFAWRPTDTVDRGLVWLRPVWRRRIAIYPYLWTSGPEFWLQHAVVKP